MIVALCVVCRREIGKISGEWLDTDENLDRWEGTTKPFTAGERRVLMARWAAEAWKRVCAKPGSFVHVVVSADRKSVV